MKKSFNHILAIIFCGLALSACTDNDYMELDKGHDALTLSALQSADVLDEALHASEAVALHWTTGTNYGTGNRIGYTLEIAPAGSGFADAYTAVDQQTLTYSWSINQENLNALLLDKFGGIAGQSQQLDARVTAHVKGQSELQTATLTFAATPYTPVTSTLYLVGDATPNGWDNWHATEMKRIDNG